VTEGFDPLEHNKRLMAIKKEHRLKTLEIAELIGAPFDTVKSWLKKANPPKCPPYAVELLEIKVSKRRLRGKRSSG